METETKFVGADIGFWKEGGGTGGGGSRLLLGTKTRHIFAHAHVSFSLYEVLGAPKRGEGGDSSLQGPPTPT